MGREEIESLLNIQVNLKLWVKVKKTGEIVIFFLEILDLINKKNDIVNW